VKYWQRNKNVITRKDAIELLEIKPGSDCYGNMRSRENILQQSLLLFILGNKNTISQCQVKP